MAEPTAGGVGLVVLAGGDAEIGAAASGLAVETVAVGGVEVAGEAAGIEDALSGAVEGPAGEEAAGDCEADWVGVTSGLAGVASFGPGFAVATVGTGKLGLADAGALAVAGTGGFGVVAAGAAAAPDPAGVRTVNGADVGWVDVGVDGP